MEKNRLVLVIAVILMIALGWVAAVPFIGERANLGLDLQGGVLVRLEAPEGTSREEMLGASEIISLRVDALGVAEPDIRLEGDRRIVVELAGLEDPEEAVRMIGTTAKLQFIRADNQELVLEGNQLKKALAGMDEKELDPNKRNVVSLEFQNEGATAFAQATKDLVAKYGVNDPKRVIAIVLDGEVISAPYIVQEITDGKASISGGFATLEEAQNLATLLNSGALPVDLTIVEQQTVGPQLGPDSIAKSVNAAIVGIVLLLIFILAIYRRPGLVAILSLVLYALMLSVGLVLIGSTITLQVIAAFLLSVGMAVDGNVLIYERIKEEIRTGKTVRVATNDGFKKAFATILDSQVTTLIAGVVLIFLGTGSIRGFAVTLCLGILIGLFTAVTFTRFILTQLVRAGIIINPGFYNVKEAEHEAS